MHELLITLFLFLTAPITAQFIAKVHLHLNVPRGELPPTGTGAPWAGEPESEDFQARKSAEDA
jgi:multicomponent K+:H+ antiporter subunit G